MEITSLLKELGAKYVISQATRDIHAKFLLKNGADEVIYPNPGFPIYESCIKFARGIPVPMPLTADNDFRPDVEKLKSLITPKTKLIIINNPGNPTGGIFEKEAELLIERINILIQREQTEMRERIKVSMYLCATAGIFLVLILV